MGEAGTIIRRLRQRKKLTQQNVADICYTTQERISRIENGRVQLPADEFLEMKRVLFSIEKVADLKIEIDERGKLACRK